MVTNATDEAAQERCYSSVRDWLQSSRSHDRTGIFSTYSMTTTIVDEGMTGTYCDGLVRRGPVEDHNWTWSGMLTTSSLKKRYFKYADRHPMPSCHVGITVCNREYWKLGNIARLDWDLGNTDMIPKNCGALSALEGSKGLNLEFDPGFDSCVIGFNNLYWGSNVWAWPDDIISRDICADDYYGTQTIRSLNHTSHKKSQVMTVSKFTFTAHALDQEDMEKVFYEEFTWDSTYTFTSPTIYIAYAQMVAYESSTTVAGLNEGFIPVHPSQLSSIVWQCADQNTGDFRDLVEAHLRHVPMGNLPSCDLVAETRRFNPADIYSDLPAAAWYAANLKYCDGKAGLYNNFQERCHTIIRGLYKPHLYVQAEAFWSYNKAMSSKSCVAPVFINDPPRDFDSVEDPTPTVTAPVFTSSVAPEYLDKDSPWRAASERSSPRRHTPIQTQAGPTALLPEMGSSEDSEDPSSIRYASIPIRTASSEPRLPRFAGGFPGRSPIQFALLGDPDDPAYVGRKFNIPWVVHQQAEMKADAELRRNAQGGRQTAEEEETSTKETLPEGTSVEERIPGPGGLSLLKDQSGDKITLPFASRTTSMTTRDGKIFEVLVPVAKDPGGGGPFGRSKEGNEAEPGGSNTDQGKGAKKKSESVRPVALNSVMVVLTILCICIWGR